jgi:hypothetical protein
VAPLNDLEAGFDFTDDAGDGSSEPGALLAGEAAARAERRLATGTIPRLELASPAMPEPPDSVRATTRMSVEEVLELRAVSLEARRKAARVETEPLEAQPLEMLPLELQETVPVHAAALPHLVPVRAAWSKRLQRWASAERLRLVERRFEPRDIVVAFAAGVLIGLLV